MTETPSPIPYPLQPGQVLDGFVLEERLHQGGMANLWKVRRETPQPGEDFPLIMKVPRIKGGEDPASIVGFEVEQMILPALKGPHVPRFVARGDWRRQAYIVMEHIQADSLRPLLDRAPLPLVDVVEIGIQVAHALTDLHHQHLVHLDIKPSNILRRADGSVVLVDFGLSRHDFLPDLLEEEFSLPMGTGPYMSPEQVQFVRNDPRSDLFALGVMLYHLATGERPFGQPNSVRQLRRRLYVEPIPPRAIRPELPSWFQEVVLHCLEVRAERRYQSATQLALDLQRPDAVTLTARAHRVQRSGLVRRFKRWFLALGAEPQAPSSVGAQVSRSPVIMAAVDVQGASAGLLEALRDVVQRLLETEPGARLACVGVMKTARIGMDELTDAQGRSHHVQQLIALKNWAHPMTHGLALEDGRLTFHVLEAPDAADALIEFAARTGVDHVVMGARGSSALRRYLGSVSTQVVTQCTCTVTVVREPPLPEAATHPVAV
ncbi:bifunctional serine/threonine-protein kinase/universal stress protein [Roseateles sp. SL47]|jgi:eukaryotic-like serine/threonine-protein kinase|uniref:serine/threonine protein kinase n=1 Tax=Roseateles sp. SL47 TaxID=2995138 RepID=UPI0022715B37|nr:bifunctional serine/threonine-protein kinase/universal stress protein [Roseateles sp. SL47]WAC75428.1 bifunctional serine/threonine-protein kinase/universal stress protein [Roseateles sp. SL47]